MIWGLVSYAKKGQWQRLLNQLKALFPRSTGWVVNNCEGEAAEGEIQGDNAQFEFGGYRVLCEKMAALNGPYVILNDTLFRTHSTRGWMKLLRGIPGRQDESVHCVYGDIRYDGEALAERSNPFLASWIFVIPNKTSLMAFKQILCEVLQEETLLLSPEYEAFLTSWIEPKSGWRGWHGASSEAEKARKRQCIVWEHRLSLRLLASGMDVRSVGEWDPGLYRRLRIADRLKTRWKAWMG